MISVPPTKVTLKAEDVREYDDMVRERTERHSGTARNITSQVSTDEATQKKSEREDDMKRRIGATR